MAINFCTGLDKIALFKNILLIIVAFFLFLPSITKAACLPLIISSNINNYNIRTAADAAGWTSGQPVCVTINSGVTVGSVSVAQPAMITGAFPIGTSVTITNNGLIVGKGGTGGAGAGYVAIPNLLPATNGGQGGAALSIAIDIFLDNSNGNIYGGGGGGGGGGALLANWGRYFTGGGGGGGAGGGSGGLVQGVLHSVCKTSISGYAGLAVGGNGGNGCTFDVTIPPGTAGGIGGGIGINGTFPGISNGSTGPNSAGSGGGGGGGGYGAYGGNGGYFNNGVTVGSPGGNGGAPGPAIIYNGFVVQPPPSVGTIIVTSNISSGLWTITGPQTILGSGLSQSNISKPIGTYTITWGGMAGFTTPVPQSLTLTSGGTITFNGTYIEVSPCPANTSKTWTVGGNTCTGNSVGVASGANDTVTDSTAPTTGSAAYLCTNGTLAVSPNAGATCSVSNTINLTSSNLSGLPTSGTTGSALSFSATVSNIGNTTTGIGFSDDFTYRYGESGGWTNITTITKSPLASGATSADNGSYTPTQTGTLYIQHCVDSTNVIDEGVNETPNCTVSSGIDVTAPVASASCTLTSINDCFLPATISGEIAGQCIVSGECEYSCDNAVWTETTNSCVASLEPPTLSVNRQTVVKDDTVTLTWDTKNGDEASCTLNYFSGGTDLIITTIDDPNIGSLNEIIPARRTYTLTCPNPSGGAPLTDTISVDVVPVGVET